MQGSCAYVMEEVVNVGSITARSMLVQLVCVRDILKKVFYVWMKDVSE